MGLVLSIPKQNQNQSSHFLRIQSFPRLERFSFECRKVIGFAFATLHDWLKKFAPLFHPIRSKTKTNRDSLARVFRRFSQLHVITWSLIGSLYYVFFVIG